MVRVSPMLARGIALAAVLVCGGRLADPPPPVDSPAPPIARPDSDRAVALVRAQDFVPLFDAAGKRIQALFPAEREQAFLDEVFSLSGKWKAVTRGRESYARYVRKSFERLVLAPADVRAMLEQVRADHAYAVEAAENRLLIAYAEDLRPFRSALSLPDLRAEHAALAQAIGPLVVKDLAMNAVSIAGSEIAAALLVGTLTSTGVVAAGAAAGPWTFGASLVAGIVAGVVLDAILGDLAEDAARAEIHRHLEEFRNRIVDAVHDALARALLDWRRLEEACVRELYQGGSHGEIAADRR